MAHLNPYLAFDNNCREAMTFYQQCVGGELELQTVGSMPEMAAQMPPELKDHILHSTLTSGGIIIMASDLSMGKQVNGNTYHLCVNCESQEELDAFFTKLSEGGKVVEPIKMMPWGAKYGALTDKFG